MTLAEIVSFIIQEGPEVVALIGEIIKAIKDNRAGVIDAQKATDQARTALAQLIGRQAAPDAQDAADFAAVTAEAEAKFSK